MKKLLTLLLLFPLFFVGCSSDDDKDDPIVTEIKIENLKDDVFIGSELQVKVVHTPSDLAAPKYTWESSNPDIATIDDTGKLKALKEGQTTVIVTASELNLTSSLIVSVLPVQATSIKLVGEIYETIVGQSFTLTYKIEPENTTNKTVSWKSSDENIATVSNAGIVTPLSDGEVTITVSLGDLKDERYIKINPINVSGITLNETSKEIEVLESFQLVATIIPTNAKNKNIYWTSSDESIAIVDNIGNVSTKKVGNTIITATSGDGGFTASASIQVYNFTDKIEVSLSRSMVSTPWESYTAINGKLQNNSKKTIIAKKVTIYENGTFLSSQDINNTLIPGADVSYSIKRDGNFNFVYEYEYNGVKYSTN